MITDETDYATVSEAARLLRVSVPTVWRWIDSGRLPAYRVGSRSIRIRRADLESLVRPARAMKERTVEDKVIRLGDRAGDPKELVAALLEGQTGILPPPPPRQTSEAAAAAHPPGPPGAGRSPMNGAICVDASVAVKWLLPEEGSEKALALLEAALSAQTDVIGPPPLPVGATHAI